MKIAPVSAPIAPTPVPNIRTAQPMNTAQPVALETSQSPDKMPEANPFADEDIEYFATNPPVLKDDYGVFAEMAWIDEARGKWWQQ
ncbi:MAG: hypothetical protein ABFS56_01240 [Pseudomonadota bacterium]